MNNVRYPEFGGVLGGLRGGGEPPYDGDMDARIATMEAKWDAVIPTLATKADIKDVELSVKTWMVATVIGLFIGFGGLFMAMSNALKPSAPAAPQAQQAPIIINVPGPAPQQQPAPAK